MHFNYDFNLVFYLAGCIFFLFLFISKRKPKSKTQRIELLKRYFRKGLIQFPKRLKLLDLQNEFNKFPLEQNVDIMDSRPLKRKGWIKRIIYWLRRFKWLSK